MKWNALASFTEKEEESEKEAEEEEEEEEEEEVVWVSPRGLLRDSRTGTTSATTIQRLMQLRIFGCFCKNLWCRQEKKRKKKREERAGREVIFVASYLTRLTV